MTEIFTTRSAAYYAEKLKAHGATHRGVDWNSVESQERRFAELLRIAEGEGRVDQRLRLRLRRAGRLSVAHRPSVRLLWLRRGAVDGRRARARHPETTTCTFTADRASIRARDYTVASGVFNVKLDAPESAWRAFVNRELDAIAAMSLRGFSFNMLTSYSDPDRKRDDLFYPEPDEVFRHCMSRFSRAVALIHDYPLYEFTVLVRL